MNINNKKSILRSGYIVKKILDNSFLIRVYDIGAKYLREVFNP
jgi:hypothetical protein